MWWSGTALPGRTVRALGAALAAGVAVITLDWAAGPPASALSAAVSAARTGAGVDPVLAGAAGVSAWACLSWFAALVTLESAACLPGVAGAASRWLAARLGPRSARVAARWLVGATMTAMPLLPAVAAPALAAPPGANHIPVTPAILDRPVATTTAAASVAAARPLDLDRPYSSPPAHAAAAPPIEPDRSPTTGYVVRPGDTLWAIASQQIGPHATAAAVAAQWPRWYAVNRGVIGADPNLIRPGELLRAPPA